jgi:hypothetical protein
LLAVEHVCVQRLTLGRVGDEMPRDAVIEEARRKRNSTTHAPHKASTFLHTQQHRVMPCWQKTHQPCNTGTHSHLARFPFCLPPLFPKFRVNGSSGPPPRSRFLSWRDPILPTGCYSRKWRCCGCLMMLEATAVEARRESSATLSLCCCCWWSGCAVVVCLAQFLQQEACRIHHLAEETPR